MGAPCSVLECCRVHLVITISFLLLCRCAHIYAHLVIRASSLFLLFPGAPILKCCLLHTRERPGERGREREHTGVYTRRLAGSLSLSLSLSWKIKFSNSSSLSLSCVFEVCVCVSGEGELLKCAYNMPQLVDVECASEINAGSHTHTHTHTPVSYTHLTLPTNHRV